MDFWSLNSMVGFRFQVLLAILGSGLRGSKESGVPSRYVYFWIFRAIFQKIAEVGFKTAEFSDLFFSPGRAEIQDHGVWCILDLPSTRQQSPPGLFILSRSPNKPLFATVSGRGGRSRVYYPLWSLWLFKFRNSEDGSKKNCTTEIPHLGEIVQIKSFRTKNGMETSENPWTC